MSKNFSVTSQSHAILCNNFLLNLFWLESINSALPTSKTQIIKVKLRGKLNHRAPQHGQVIAWSASNCRYPSPTVNTIHLKSPIEPINLQINQRSILKFRRRRGHPPRVGEKVLCPADIWSPRVEHGNYHTHQLTRTTAPWGWWRSAGGRSAPCLGANKNQASFKIRAARAPLFGTLGEEFGAAAPLHGVMS